MPAALKAHFRAALLSGAAALALAAPARGVTLRLDPAAGPPPAGALRLLEAALRGSPEKLQICLDLDRSRGQPESFAIHKSQPCDIRVAAPDDTGLMYGIFELLGQIETAPAGAPLASAVKETAAAPQRRVRSLSLFPQNQDLEKEWVYSEEFWNRYFELLARSRFNYFLLTFGHQTSYFAPPFPFLMETPGFPQVRVPSLTPRDRARNLAMLQMASSLAEKWGIRFILGIWQQHALTPPGKMPENRNLVEGLTYDALFDYIPQSLAQLLRLCPKIQGLQFRMNAESGMREEDQTRFFSKVFAALRPLGRPLYLDLRAKGLRQETIDAARASGFPVTVSTKYWREHFGLPFHATGINPFDARNYRRYGYWDLLRQDRNYDVLYQFWTGGSLKVLLWGSLDYARRFAASTAFGDSLGFEVFAPLTQKGFLNWPGGAWRVFADPKREHYRWEFERYWAFYLAFGLAGYGGQQAPIFEAEFRKRFGADAAAPVLQAYDAASWVIPMVTAFHQPESSEFRYWPEMDTGGLTDVYIGVPTGDDGRFYPICQYVEDALAGTLSARLTPAAMADRFDQTARLVAEALGRAAPRVSGGNANAEFHATRTDLEVHAALARYHAARLRSGTGYQFFRRTGSRAHLLVAIAQAQAALAQWKRIAELTAGLYYRHMVFNSPPDQIGHWADLLPLLERDAARLGEIDRLFLEFARRPAAASSLQVKTPWSFLPLEWKQERGVLSRWIGPQRPTTPVEYPATEGQARVRTKMQAPAAVIRDLLASVSTARVAHVPLRAALAGRPATLHASLLGASAGPAPHLRYRSRGRQSYVSLPMRQTEENVYTAALPPAAAGNTLEYYLEAGPGILNGSPQQPHSVPVCRPSPGPEILHTPAATARAGVDLPLTVKVKGPQPAVIRLHHRRANQALEWALAPMERTPSGEYLGVIPGPSIAPNWDLMYAIEALDACGQGAFHPDLWTTQPFFLVRVASAAEKGAQPAVR